MARSPPPLFPSGQFGIVVGLILEFTDNFKTLGSDLSISLESIADMNPEIILYALLPILIFESAFFTDVHIFLTQLWQVRRWG